MKLSKDLIAVGTGDQSLAGVKQRLAQWRTSRVRGERIPRALWAAAVQLATRGDARQIAQELRIDYERLMKRLGHGSVVPSTGTEQTRFIELVAPGTLGSAQCVIEMHNVRGAKMRIELKGGDLVGCVASVSNSFWSAR
jgi:hypothetical protein